MSDWALLVLIAGFIGAGALLFGALDRFDAWRQRARDERMRRTRGL